MTYNVFDGTLNFAQSIQDRPVHKDDNITDFRVQLVTPLSCS